MTFGRSHLKALLSPTVSLVISGPAEVAAVAVLRKHGSGYMAALKAHTFLVGVPTTWPFGRQTALWWFDKTNASGRPILAGIGWPLRPIPTVP